MARAIVGRVPRTAKPEAAERKRRRAALGGVAIGNTEKCGCPVRGARWYVLPQPSVGETDIAQRALKACILLIDVGVKIYFTTVFDNGCTVGDQNGYGLLEPYGA